jgi:transposase
VTCIQNGDEARIFKNHHPTIITIPDELWVKIKIILPKEKPPRTIGRPIIPYRKVLDGILYSLEQDASGKCSPKNTVQVQHAIVDSKNGIN